MNAEWIKKMELGEKSLQMYGNKKMKKARMWGQANSVIYDGPFELVKNNIQNPVAEINKKLQRQYKNWFTKPVYNDGAWTWYIFTKRVADVACGAINPGSIHKYMEPGIQMLAEY